MISVGTFEAYGADHPSTPAGGVAFAQLQKVGLQLLCVVLEALGEGADQTCRAAFVFDQLYAVPWKNHRVRHKLNK